MVALAITRHGAAGIGRFALFAYLFLATASHGVLDAMTGGGLGVTIKESMRRRAYDLYEQRGKVDGFALDDWGLQAEREILGAQKQAKAKTASASQR
jgi:hypothetical protein